MKKPNVAHLQLIVSNTPPPPKPARKRKKGALQRTSAPNDKLKEHLKEAPGATEARRLVETVYRRIDEAADWYMKRSGLDKTRVALECGVDPGNFTRYRKRRVDLQISTLLGIARGLGVDPGWLLTKQGAAPDELAEHVEVRHEENKKYLADMRASKATPDSVPAAHAKSAAGSR